MDETILIRRMQEGDISALESFVKRYQEEAIRSAYLITQDKELAKDVAQSAFIRAFKASRGFDSSRKFAPWFFKIVINAAIKASQRAQKTLPLESDETESMALFAKLSEQPESAIESSEFIAEVESALQVLKPEHRALIVQKYFLDYSEQELAAEWQTPIGTIKSRLHTARQQLKAWLKQPLPKWEENS